MNWILLALISAFCVALTDALSKHSLHQSTIEENLISRFTLPGIILSPCLFIYAPTELSKHLGLDILILLPLEITAMWLYLSALKSYPLAQTLPYLSFTPIFTILTSMLILGEEPSLHGICGVFLIVFASMLFNIGLTGTGLQRLEFSSGSKLMLGVSLIYSITSVLGKDALQYAQPLYFAALYLCALSLSSILFVVWRTKVSRMHFLFIPNQSQIIIGIIMSIMILTHYLALNEIEVSYMISIKRTSLLFGIIFGALWFHEQQLVKNLIAGLIMIIGSWFIVR